MARKMLALVAVCAIVILTWQVVHLRRQIAGPGPSRALPTGAYRAGLSPEVEQELERIATLGYIAGNEPAASKTGVVVNEPQSAFDGLTLLTYAERPEAFLVDMDGRVAHSWTHSGSTYWSRAHVFPNGDLLAITCYPPGLIRLTSRSDLLWVYGRHAHHDLTVSEDGSIFVLVQEATTRPDILGGAPVLDDVIVHLDAQGRELESISLLDAFERSRQGLNWLADHPFPEDGDIFHTNSIQVIRGGGVDRALLSIRSIDTVAIVDLSTGTVVWAMDGPWHKQHEARYVGGNLLLFDNLGLTQALGNDGQSRVLEIDMKTRDLVWSYSAPGFYSHAAGCEERLPNGNTLITESLNGRVFEVAPACNQIVWEFVSPFTVSDQPEFALAILRAERIPADYFSEGFLTSGGQSSGAEPAGAP
jgi:hypothetical protein